MMKLGTWLMMEFVERTTVKFLEVIGDVAMMLFWQVRMTGGTAAKTSVWRSFGCCKSIKLAVVAFLIYLSCLL